VAVTTYGTNDPMAVKLWAKRLGVETLKNCWITRLTGPSSSSVIQVKDDLNKSAGDKITYGLRMQLSGNGVIGDGTLSGNEEALTVYTDAIVVNQLRHAVRSAGRMSQQRVPFAVRDEALSGLRDWWADRIDWWGMNQLCGNPNTQTPNGSMVADTRWTGLQATIVPDSGHYKTAHGSGNDENITSTDVFTLSMLDKSVEAARTASPALRPVTIDGKPMYVAILHPYSVTDIRTNTSTGQWLDIQKAAMQGGEIGDNPIFDGSLGVYNGVILHSDYRVTYGANSSTNAAITTVRRNVFLGAQAGMLAFGRDNGPERFTWVEELFDYENELGVSAGLIAGMKKTVFNSQDYAVIVMSSYAAAH
jgi:N4-gp56 family major capsid protein